MIRAGASKRSGCETTTADMASLTEVCRGLPLDPLPPAQTRDVSVPHAPVKTPNLTPDEKKVAHHQNIMLTARHTPSSPSSACSPKCPPILSLPPPRGPSSGVCPRAEGLWAYLHVQVSPHDSHESIPRREVPHPLQTSSCHDAYDYEQS